MIKPLMADTEDKFTIKNSPRFHENPFLKHASHYQRGSKRTLVKGGKAVVDRETGEYENVAEIVQIEKVDDEKFVKVYTADIARMFSLSTAGMRVLCVILDQVQGRPDSDTIMLNMKIVKSYFEGLGEKSIGQATYYRVVPEMLNKAFLARCEISDDMFYINPHLFFNGDRVRLVKEYHILRNKSQTLPGLDEE